MEIFDKQISQTPHSKEILECIGQIQRHFEPIVAFEDHEEVTAESDIKCIKGIELDTLTRHIEEEKTKEGCEILYIGTDHNQTRYTIHRVEENMNMLVGTILNVACPSYYEIRMDVPGSEHLYFKKFGLLGTTGEPAVILNIQEWRRARREREEQEPVSLWNRFFRWRRFLRWLNRKL